MEDGGCALLQFAPGSLPLACLESPHNINREGMNVDTIRQYNQGGRLRRAAAGALLVLGSTFALADEPANFTGTWSVAWCDKTQPGKDCGGFTVHLLQQETWLCGTHSGATPNLTRVDEGDDPSILGTVMGDTAVLTIRSGRNDSIHLVTARRQAGSLDWQLTDTVRKGDTDTEVIALREKLVNSTGPTHAQGFTSMQKACLARRPTGR